MKQLNNIDTDYIENNTIDFSEYFEDIIGITRPKNGVLEIIELYFSAKQAPYAFTKPLHESQKNKEHDENGLTITLEVIPNYELKSLLLSFGKEVKVVSPLWLKKEIRGMACPDL
jgi:predicted DNA-binding transcriptional regulator YafY